jgi:hypothetical protein
MYTFEAVSQPVSVHKQLIIISRDGQPIATQHEFDYFVTPAVGVTLSENEQWEVSSLAQKFRVETDFSTAPKSWPVEIEAE